MAFQISSLQIINCHYVGRFIFTFFTYFFNILSNNVTTYFLIYSTEL